jgi:hypothetical protein
MNATLDTADASGDLLQEGGQSGLFGVALRASEWCMFAVTDASAAGSTSQTH